MTNQTTSVEAALDAFIEKFHQLYASQPIPLPQQEYDLEWLSPCYQNPQEEGQLCTWQPVRQDVTHDLFEGLAHALETDIHPDIKAYFTRYWSDPLPARHQDGDLELIFVWNEQDYERLRANMIGHALLKKRRKQPLTLFFGCTAPEDMTLCIDNETGEVVLEKPGKKAHRTVAPSIADFILQLSPRTIT